VRNVAWKPRSRCGSASIHARRTGSNSTGIGTPSPEIFEVRRLATALNVKNLHATRRNREPLPQGSHVKAEKYPCHFIWGWRTRSGSLQIYARLPCLQIASSKQGAPASRKPRYKAEKYPYLLSLTPQISIKEKYCNYNQGVYLSFAWHVTKLIPFHIYI